MESTSESRLSQSSHLRRRPSLMNSVISRLAAAGKTTGSHCLCLILGYEYFSASTRMLQMLGLNSQDPARFWYGNLGQVKLARNNSNVDAELNTVLVDAATTSEHTIFDSASLAW